MRLDRASDRSSRADPLVGQYASHQDPPCRRNPRLPMNLGQVDASLDHPDTEFIMKMTSKRMRDIGGAQQLEVIEGGQFFISYMFRLLLHCRSYQ
jgi:hypothetical protein